MSRARCIALVALVAAFVALPASSRSAGGGGGRMAVSSVSMANAGGARPSQLPANAPSRPADGSGRRVIYNPYGWYWYGEYDEPEPEPEPAPQPAAPPPPPPPPPSVGTTLLALPPGCSTVERNGKFVRSCGGAFYEESFQGDRVVYTVVQ
ncbi:MAG TPA: hypothetical protein VFL14_03260 [Xanthomonadales bacterium]|nr:hypothetical protein [Xanthomonadales bacterium]